MDTKKFKSHCVCVLVQYNNLFLSGNLLLTKVQNVTGLN